MLLPVVPDAGQQPCGGGRLPNTGWWPVPPSKAVPGQARVRRPPPDGRRVATAGVVAKVSPIWLGSSTKCEQIVVRDIMGIVPPDLHFHESVLAIQRFEEEAGHCEAERKFIVAADCVEQAIILRRKFLGGTHRDFVSALERYVVNCNFWAMQCLSSGQNAASLQLLKKAEFMTEADNVPNFSRRVALRAATFNNFCCYYRHRGKLNAALQFGEKALKLEKQFKDAESPARTHLNYAVLLSMALRHEEAIEHIEYAVASLNDEERAISYELGELGPTVLAAAAAAGDGGRRQRHEDCVSALVAAYFNMCVELFRLQRQEVANEWAQRAVSIAKRKLGMTHPLTAKMLQFTDAIELDRLGLSPPAGVGKAVTVPVVDPRPCTEVDATLEGAKPIPFSKIKDKLLVPVPPKKGDSLHFRRDVKLLGKETIYYRGLGSRPENEVSIAEPFFGSRQKSEALPGFAGSAAIQQLAHGCLPKLGKSGGCRSLSASPVLGGSPARSTRTNEDAGDILHDKDAPVASPELRAAFEYYNKQQKLRENIVREDEQTSAAEERIQAIGTLQGRLEQRRGKGLPVASDSNRHRAATKIQALFRGYTARCWDVKELARQPRQEKRAPRCGSASGRVASAPAGLSDMKRRVAFRVIYAARRAFVETSAAVKLQKTWRGNATRRDICQQVAAVASTTATRLQALCRRWGAVSRCWRRFDAAVMIQCAWRRRLGRNRMERKRTSAWRLTRVSLGHAARRRLAHLHWSAEQMQRLARGFLVRRRLLHRHEGVLAFQRVFRSCRARRAVFHGRCGVIKLQALWRGRWERRRAKLLVEAARQVQRQVRLRQWLKILRQLHAVANRIASIWKGYKLRDVKPFYKSACRIQARIRGIIVRKRARRWRPAAVQIQAWQRGWHVRYRQRVRLALALTVQKLERRRQVHRRLDALQDAVVACQRRVQGMRLRLVLMQRMHPSAMRIQAWWRSVLVRCWLLRRNRAAQCIQKLFRCKCRRSTFKAQHTAASRIRAGWKGFVVRDTRRRLQVAALCLTRVARGSLPRQHLRKCRAAARVIQRRWRGAHTRLGVRRKRDAAVRIQSALRCRRQSDRFTLLRRCIAVALQMRWHRRVARRRFLRKHRAAVLIQSIVRMRRARRTVQSMRSAACSIQCQWRCRKLRIRAIAAEIGAIAIQHVWRGFLGRRPVVRAENAAVTLQSFMRRMMALGRARRRRCAVQLIALWRKGRLSQRRHWRIRREAIRIQSFWRGRKLRLRLWKASALIGMLKGRWIYKKQCRAIRFMQTTFRKFRSHAKMRLLKTFAVRLQADFRGKIVRLQLLRKHKAATVLQSWCKQMAQRKRFLCKKFVQVKLSSLFRQARARMLVLEVLQHSRRIVSVAKTLAVRLRVARMRRAALVIQRHCRGVLARRRVANFQKIIRVQCLFRRYRAAHAVDSRRYEAHVRDLVRKAVSEQHRVQQEHSAATKIQSYVRGSLVRYFYGIGRQRAAGRIQRAFVMGRPRRLKARRADAAVLIQCYARKMAAQRYVRHLRAATQCLQKAVRFFLIRSASNRRTFNEFVDRSMAATTIQKKFRLHSGVWRHMRRRVAATRIQASVRQFLTRRDWKKRRMAAVRIQVSIMLPCLAKKLANRQRRNLIKMQAYGRQVLAKKRVREIRAAVSLLQSVARRWLARRRVAHLEEAATRLQAYWRMYHQKNKAHPHRLRSLWIMQSECRRFAVEWVTRRRLKAARHIQNVFRRRRAYWRMCQMRGLATALQRIWRARQGRHRYGFAFRTLCKVPAFLRCWRYRFHVLPRQAKAAKAIQRIFRGRCTRAAMHRRLQAAVSLQAWWRYVVGRRRWQKQRCAVRAIQGAAYLWHFRRRLRVSQGVRKIGDRQLKEVSVIQAERFYRGYRVRMVQRQQLDAVLTISRMWRGCKARERVQLHQDSAIRLQRQGRIFLAWRRSRRRLESVFVIQPFLDMGFRRDELKHNLERVHRIQALVKMRVAVRHFKNIRAAVIDIQRIARGGAARRHLARQAAAASKISRAAWRWVARRHVARKRAAAVKVQAAWRGFLVREGIRELRARTTRIQSAFRMHFCYAAHQRKRWGGSVLVGGMQMFRMRRIYRRKRAAATFIACFRRRLEWQLMTLRVREGAMKIQRAWRTAKLTAEYRDFCAEILATAKVMKRIYRSAHAVQIQRWYRVSRQRPFQARRMVVAIVRVQAKIRSYLACREARRCEALLGVRVVHYLSRPATVEKDKFGRLTRCRFLDRAAGARLSLAKARGQHFVIDVDSLTWRQRWMLQQASVAKLQSYFRWCRYLKAVTTLQRHVRGCLARRALRRRHLGAVKIQALGRRRLATLRVARLRHLRAGVQGSVDTAGAKVQCTNDSSMNSATTYAEGDQRDRPAKVTDLRKAFSSPPSRPFRTATAQSVVKALCIGAAPSGSASSRCPK